MEDLELCYSKARRRPWLALTEHPVEASGLEGWDMEFKKYRK